MKEIQFLQYVDLGIVRKLGTNVALVYSLVRHLAQLEDQVCSASEITMAQQLGLSFLTVHKALDILEKEGLIRFIGKSQNKTKKYVPVRGGTKKFNPQGIPFPFLTRSNYARRFGSGRARREKKPLGVGRDMENGIYPSISASETTRAKSPFSLYVEQELEKRDMEPDPTHTRYGVDHLESMGIRCDEEFRNYVNNGGDPTECPYTPNLNFEPKNDNPFLAVIQEINRERQSSS